MHAQPRGLQCWRPLNEELRSSDPGGPVPPRNSRLQVPGTAQAHRNEFPVTCNSAVREKQTLATAGWTRFERNAGLHLCQHLMINAKLTALTDVDFCLVRMVANRHAFSKTSLILRRSVNYVVPLDFEAKWDKSSQHQVRCSFRYSQSCNPRHRLFALLHSEDARVHVPAPCQGS